MVENPDIIQFSISILAQAGLEPLTLRLRVQSTNHVATPSPHLQRIFVYSLVTMAMRTTLMLHLPELDLMQCFH